MSVRQRLHAYADELLADGRWHDRQDLIAALARKVPPGYASRAAAAARESDAKWRRERRGVAGAVARHGSTDPAAAVARGQRITAMTILRSSRFEHRTLASGVRQVRLAR